MRIEAKPAPEPEPEWVLPVEGYHLTGRFAASSALWSNTHTGLDFAAPVGTPIRAVTGGVVTESGPAGPFGTMTVVTGPDGTEFRARSEGRPVGKEWVGTCRALWWQHLRKKKRKN